MRIAINCLAALSIALMPVGYAEAAKKVHRSYHSQVARGPVSPAPQYIPHNAAAEGNNANSMSGSNSAPENAIGRSNCC